MHVAVVKLSSIGDVLQAAQAVLLIKKKYPNAKVTWIVDERFQALVHSLNLVDTIIGFKGSLLKKGILSFFKGVLDIKKKLKNQFFEIVYDMQGNSKSALVTFLCNADLKVGFSKKCVSESLNLLVTNKKIFASKTLPMTLQYCALIEEEVLKVETSKKEKNSSAIMICPGSNWENKKLSKYQLAEFINSIQKEFSNEIILVGGSEKELQALFEMKSLFLKEVQIVGPLEWSDWICMLKNVSIVISADSCALHLARLYEIPTFSYFGPSSGDIYSPISLNHTYYQGECPFAISFSKRCPKLRTCQSGACIKQIDPKVLFDRFSTFYKS